MDIQRTVLWVVFSLSLLLLWDNWMRYNGKQSMFFPNTTQQQAAKPTTTPANRGDVPQASTPAAAPSVPTGAAPVKSEVVTITTDVIMAEIDTLGGELRHLELLKHKDTA